jgi:regulatory protein
MGWRSGEDGRVSDEGVSVDGTSGAGSDSPAPKPRRKRPEPTPAQRALGLLVRREHSRVELTRKLTARGVEREDAVAAVDKLEAAGWQNDARFAELLVRSRAATGYGPVRIRAELGMHSLGREAVATAMETAEVDWEAHARDLVRRRFGEDLANDRDRQRKAADWLLRRGFTGAHVRAATRFDPDD